MLKNYHSKVTEAVGAVACVVQEVSKVEQEMVSDELA